MLTDPTLANNLIPLHIAFTLLFGTFVVWLLPKNLRILFLGMLGLEFAWSLVMIAVEAADKVDFWSWFFESSAERNSTAIFTSVLLLMIGFTAVNLAGRSQSIKIGERAFWIFLGLFFAFLSLDEFYSLHETINFWRKGYFLSGVIIAVASSLLFLFSNTQKRKAIFLFVVGLGIMGFAGVFLDTYSNQHPISIGITEFTCSSIRGFMGAQCQHVGITEEFFEMVGATTMLLSLIFLTQLQIPETQRPITRRIIIAIGTGWAIWLIAWIWILPSIEARFSAESVAVDYADRKITIVGYDLSQKVVHAGDMVDVTMYLQSSEFLHTDYSLSVHFYTQPTPHALSIAQDDMLLGEFEYPTRGWLPNVAVRNRFQIQIPEDIRVPSSYRLVALLWEDTPGNLFNPENHQQEMVGEYAVILDTITVLSSENPSPSPNIAGYQFSDTFTLIGYDAPEAVTIGGELSLQFWWQVQKNVDTDLSHFVHLFHEDSDEFFVFDHIPFEGHLPTSTWVEGLGAVDTWTIQLPAEMPGGTYRIQTGMFHLGTAERYPVTDTDGRTVQDNSIPLTTIILNDGD